MTRAWQRRKRTGTLYCRALAFTVVPAVMTALLLSLGFTPFPLAITNKQGVVTHRDEEVQLSDEQETVRTFPMVDDATTVRLRLTAVAEVMARDNEETHLSAEDEIDFNGVDQSMCIEDLYLRYDPKDMQILVTGKTGVFCVSLLLSSASGWLFLFFFFLFLVSYHLHFLDFFFLVFFFV